jgi:hypothetical protein
MSSVPLSQLMTYENASVIDQFCHHYPEVTRQQAQQLFRDLLGWMWLSLHRKVSARQTWLFGPLLELDKVWHIFILHTRDYASFCATHFGQFFHHDFETIGQEYLQSPDELADFLRDCFEHLGEDWVNRHFSMAY